MGARFHVKSWTFDILRSAKVHWCVDVFIDKSLVYRLLLTYGLMVFSLKESKITYD